MKIRSITSSSGPKIMTILGFVGAGFLVIDTGTAGRASPDHNTQLTL
jgi:hypothetical protein